VTKSACPTPPGDALAAYLRAIVGREPPSSLVELRPLHLDGRRVVARAFLPVGELAEVERRVRALAARLNVYVGVAPRTRAEGHVGAVAHCWVLWADLDTGASIERLHAFRPWPSIVVRSGTGAHAYWRLSQALAPAHAQRANRRLALALGGDLQATDAARILRPPGTLNHKHSPPSEVRCSRLEPVTFTAADVVGSLPDSEHYRPRPARPPRRPVWTDAPRPERVLEGLARTVAEAREGGRNARLFWAVCRALEHVSAGDLDELAALDRLSMAALETGLGGGEIRATIGSAQRTTRRAA
jgi:hypothetical protein